MPSLKGLILHFNIYDMITQKLIKDTYLNTIVNNFNEAGWGFNDALEKSSLNNNESNTNTNEYKPVWDKFQKMNDPEHDNADVELDNLLNWMYNTPDINNRNSDNITDSTSSFDLYVDEKDKLKVNNYTATESMDWNSINDTVTRSWDDWNSESIVYQNPDMISHSVTWENGNSYIDQSSYNLATWVSDNTNGQGSFMDQNPYSTNITSYSQDWYNSLHIWQDWTNEIMTDFNWNTNYKNNDSYSSRHEITNRNENWDIIEQSSKEQTAWNIYNMTKWGEQIAITWQDKNSVYSTVYWNHWTSDSYQNEYWLTNSVDDNNWNFWVVWLNANWKDEYFGKDYETKTFIHSSREWINVKWEEADIKVNWHSLTETSNRSKHNAEVNRHQQHQIDKNTNRSKYNAEVNRHQQHQIDKNTNRSKYNAEVNRHQQHQIDKNTKDIKHLKSDAFINNLTEWSDWVAVWAKATTDWNPMLWVWIKKTFYNDWPDSLYWTAWWTVDGSWDTYWEASVIYKHKF